MTNTPDNEAGNVHGGGPAGEQGPATPPQYDRASQYDRAPQYDRRPQDGRPLQYGGPAPHDTTPQPEPLAPPAPQSRVDGTEVVGAENAAPGGVPAGGSNGGSNGGSDGGYAGGASAHAPSMAPAVAAPQQGNGNGAHPKSRTGALIAGLAIGALLGGAVGGGVAAVVAANTSQHAVAQGTGGAITLNNAENATAISGVAAVATPSVVTLEVAGANSSGSGSGVIYNDEGYIITNAHVVTLDGAAGNDAKIRVKLSDGRILAGDLVGVDPYADLAVVKVDGDNLQPMEVADSDKLDVGDLTVAIGAPLNLANTVTSGVVSATNRGISVGSPLIPQDPSGPDGDSDEGDGGGSSPWDFRFGLPDRGEDGQNSPQQTAGAVTLPVIQTDASINPGNSGGALLNGKGELIGINVAIASPTSADGVAGSAGLGFAIPSNLATRVADALIAGEQPSHGLLGASVADSSADTDEDANHAGGLLVDVAKDGAAAKAGLRTGDVITAVNGVPAVDGTSVSALIRMNEGGSTVSIDYTRGGTPDTVDAKLGSLDW